MPTVRIRDVSLFVRTMGAGSPIVLMHGGPGLDHTTLLGLAPLARDHRLIFYDHRCNGRSSGDLETMTWDNLTVDADALRATFGFDRWVVLGHSFGGQVALMYALRYYHHIGIRDLPAMLAGALRMKRRPAAHRVGFGRLLKNWSVMERLREIDTPTLVVAGRDDSLFPPECQAILADRLPNATLEIIERAGHNPQHENPGAIVDVIRAFLECAESRVAPQHAIAVGGSVH